MAKEVQVVFYRSYEHPKFHMTRKWIVVTRFIGIRDDSIITIIIDVSILTIPNRSNYLQYISI